MATIVTAGNRRALQARSAPTKKTERAYRSFLEHLAATCNVTEAARAAGMSTALAYRRRQLDAAFAAAWREAIQAGYERLEEALLAHALSEVEFDANAITVEIADDDRAAAGTSVEAPARPVGGDTATDRAARARAARRDRGQAGVTALEGKVARVGVQLALAMLNRRDAAERRGRPASRRPRASVEQIERELGAKLDNLARRLGEQAQ